MARGIVGPEGDWTLRRSDLLCSTLICLTEEVMLLRIGFISFHRFVIVIRTIIYIIPGVSDKLAISSIHNLALLNHIYRSEKFLMCNLQSFILRIIFVRNLKYE